MKNKKKIAFVAIAASLAVIAVAVIFIVISHYAFKTANLNEILPYDEPVRFSMATLSKRSTEQGAVTDLLVTTSEENAALSEDTLRLLSQYSYRAVSQQVSSGDFVCLSFAYSETMVTRIEIYSDGTLLIFSENDTSIYQALHSSTTELSPYKALYEYLTGERL